MKNRLSCLATICLLGGGAYAQDQPTAGMQATVDEKGTGEITLTAKGVLPKPKLFFTADVVSVAKVSAAQVVQSMQLELSVLQGHPDVLTLGLQGEGEIISVTGERLVDWAVRTSADGKKQFLDLKPVKLPGKPKPRRLKMTVKSLHKIKALPIQTQILTLTPGEASGFALQLEIDDQGVDTRVLQVSGMLPLEKEGAFYSKGDHTLTLGVDHSGVAPAAVELRGVRIVGSIDEKLGSARLVLSAVAHVSAVDGGKVDLLSGRAAVAGLQSNPDYRLALTRHAHGVGAYQLEFDRAGQYPVELEIIARIDEDKAGWKTIDFTTPGGAVVPVSLTGLSQNVEFKKSQPLHPRANAQTGSVVSASEWRGFLPATGHCFLAWKKGRKAGEGKLAYTSKGLTDVTVGAGLMRQSTRMELKVLQGKINGITLRMEGPGEVIDVSGTHVVGWTVTEGQGGARNLKVSLSLPLDNGGMLKIRSQQALGSFPVSATPLRLTPEGVLRHSGYVRLSNAGAVRLETADVEGMMQLSPDKFPEEAIESRQVFVYRYPSADYTWSVRADQILPEVSLNEVLVYEQTESDRIIRASLELDIREAPLREWELRIPDGYAVASLTGAEVADYVVGSSVENKLRDVKVLFGKAVLGRQLINLRLEKNAPVQAGVWPIPVMQYPGVKSVRGHIGVAAAAGWRVAPGKLTGITETPLSYFPIKSHNIQQTYRLRSNADDKPWSAEMKIDAREQSIQADVFHLYSLKEGLTYGSVLLNYFVVGAPVSEWELSIPEAFGNVSIEGQNVRQWRRVGADRVVVQLEQPVSGAATLLVTFENVMSARGGSMKLGQVHPLNVQGESGFIEVVSPVQVNLKVAQKTPGLLAINAQELPAEFRMLTTAPAISAWQYAARPFELEVDVAWYKPGETLDQVVDFAELKSRVSRDGHAMTEASFYVRSRGRQALKMTLPVGATLWEAKANGRSITARMDDDLYLLPLPAADDPNKPVHVLVRYGGASKTSAKVQLGAPVLTAPMVIAGWKVSADKGRLLVPHGSGSGVRTPPLTETGFESLQRRGWSLFVLAALLVSGVWLLRRRNPTAWSRLLSIIWFSIVLVLALILAREVLAERRVNRSFVEITAQVVSSESPVNVTLSNVAPWRAMISWLGCFAAALGVVVMLASLVIRRWGKVWVRTLAFAAIAGGILAQRGGGVVFFAILAVIALVLLVLALIRTINHWSRWNRDRLERQEIDRVETDEAIALGSADGADGLGIEGVSKLLILSGVIGSLCFGNAVEAKEVVAPAAVATPVMSSVSQTWKIKDDRLYATMNITLNAEQGVSYLLLREPAVLTSFEGEGLRVTKIKKGESTVWMIACEQAGVIKAVASYEMAMPENHASFILPTGQAAIQKITASIDESGLELYSKAAVQTVRDPESNQAKLVLAPLQSTVIGIRPKGRDIDAEETKFYAEIANLYLPSPGVVDGVHQVMIRPSSGKVDQLVLTVPTGFAVGEVAGASVGNWRFDPASKQLTVALEPAQSRAFSIQVETQRGLDALPAGVKLNSMTVAGDAGETNMIGLAFGQEAQPGKITGQGLSVVNVDDFDSSLIPNIPNAKDMKRGILHKVYRSASGAGSLSLEVAPVKPEVRVDSMQELTLGSERILLSSMLDVNITRAGIFKLSFPLPSGLEVESLSGAALSHWTETEVKGANDKKGKRIITLHLNGKTLGKQKFTLVFTGSPAVGTGEGNAEGKGAWSVPRLLLNEAVRQSGHLLVMPEKGIRIRAIDRKNVSRVNTRSSLRTQSAAAQESRMKQAGGLAFRLLQSDWKLTLGVEKLDPWITAGLLHEVTLREGQTRTRLSVAYQIEHAAVKSVYVKLPGLSEEETRTVRASGTAVKEIVHLKEDLWEIRFRRGILGSIPVQIEYQRGADRGKGGAEVVSPALFPKAKRVTYFMAVRTTGRLDMQAGKPGNGWRATDWTAVPKNLRNPADTSVPNLCYRLNEPEGTLQVALKRHEMADTLKLRVTGGKMMTIFSPGGDTLTSVTLKARVLEKSTLRISLPTEASLYNVLVNDESVHVVREGDAHLFHVASGPVESEPAIVSLVYSTKATDGDIKLAAPGFNVPLESLEWNVLVPEGYRLDSASGEFELRESLGRQDYSIKDYLSAIRRSRSEGAQKGQQSLQKANDYLRQGKRKEAAKELSKVTKNFAVDQASNEDARVQLRQLQTQQALWGLNSRRQRIYLDNKAAGNGVFGNRDLEDAAINNPLFQGQNEFDVRKVDDFLRGNTLEEKKTLKQIANRLISQQIATEPAPQTISTVIRGRGEILRFTRGVQVSGGKELALEIDIEPSGGVNTSWSLLLLIGVGLTGALVLKKL